MSAHAIANKFRRALRNKTGASFTLYQLREMAGWGVLVELSRIEANELCPVNEAPGALPQTDGQDISLPPSKSRGALSIAELSRGL